MQQPFIHTEAKLISRRIRPVCSLEGLRSHVIMCLGKPTSIDPQMERVHAAMSPDDYSVVESLVVVPLKPETPSHAYEGYSARAEYVFIVMLDKPNLPRGTEVDFPGGEISN